ncbi:TetR/AcrR family transcriptional regulator [Leptotrichia sp. oral taxon 847]|uniref:TetR/AcrR family transcriptional regulator n=1 Tax=Leptotrichia sp. oral taxon 847 TaxID=1785996 RepID=UPI000768225B|nr:TetR/AcrR family transcriptional regulator [Leptotrichia sp. oral taxon 847]AMD94653.1 TetR family transcriptional regulator [Leptotrichia sp. oral taxon 847]
MKRKKRIIIQQSAKLFYYKGYINTNLTDIFQECNIPNDYFYKFFSSKEEVLFEVIKYHTENLINFFNTIVNDLSISKFREFFQKYFENIKNNKFHGGSPLGNLSLELSDINNPIREELIKSYQKIELRFSFFITTLKYSSLAKLSDISSESLARILIALFEGTILLLKTEKQETAINDFFIFFDQTFKPFEKEEEEKIEKNEIEAKNEELENNDDDDNFPEEISIAQNFSDGLESIETQENNTNAEDFKEPDMEELEKMENLTNVFDALNSHFKNTFEK